MNWSSIFDAIISKPELHARFLNTLSMMENSGARKISASENKNTVTLAVLKHAAEEHRHAFYLKKQIEKLHVGEYTNYFPENLIAPIESRFYLDYLDLRVCRFLKDTYQLAGYQLRFLAYLMVTYSIEVRAEELYPAYQEALDRANLKINVKSIITEEIGHLAEMRRQLLSYFGEDWQEKVKPAIAIEHELFSNWMKALLG